MLADEERYHAIDFVHLDDFSHNLHVFAHLASL
jgi:hypothetical protein